LALLQDWTTGAAYGSDEAGLICGYLFDAAASTPARAVNSAQAAQWLANHPADADAPWPACSA
jgi:zinc transporter